MIHKYKKDVILWRLFYLYGINFYNKIFIEINVIIL